VLTRRLPLSAPSFQLRHFSLQPCQGFGAVEQLSAQLAFSIGYYLAGSQAGKGCNICYPHCSDEVVQPVCFSFSEELFYCTVIQIPKVKKACFREATPRVTTGVHIEIRREIGIHIAAVCLIIGENISAFERRRATRVYERFGEKREAMIPQKLFIRIIL